MIEVSHLSGAANPGIAHEMVKIARATRAEADLQRLAREAAGCQDCDLYRNATPTVFGQGAANARIMLLGEQPGDREDKAGEPFVGPAGRILDRALDEVGLCRDDVYVTNAVKHIKWTAIGSKFRVGAARGEILDLDGRAVVATIHPSAVLRVREPDDRDRQYAGLVAGVAEMPMRPDGPCRSRDDP